MQKKSESGSTVRESYEASVSERPSSPRTSARTAAAASLSVTAGRGSSTAGEPTRRPAGVMARASRAEGAERRGPPRSRAAGSRTGRSEEHTSELQSLTNLVCRLLLEKKKTKKHNQNNTTTT